MIKSLIALQCKQCITLALLWSFCQYCCFMAAHNYQWFFLSQHQNNFFCYSSNWKIKKITFYAQSTAASKQAIPQKDSYHFKQNSSCQFSHCSIVIFKFIPWNFPSSVCNVINSIMDNNSLYYSHDCHLYDPLICFSYLLRWGSAYLFIQHFV